MKGYKMCLVPIFIPVDPNNLPDFDLPKMKWWKWLIEFIVFLIGILVIPCDFIFPSLFGIKIFPVGLIVWFICFVFCLIFPIIFDED